MLIRVMYTDRRFDMVEPKVLNDLLDRQKITCFMRSRLWAVVGRDPIRSNRSNKYRGKERRSGQGELVSKKVI